MNDSRMEIDTCGDKIWRNKKGQIHRENRPALILSTGETEWCINDENHRIDGPAINYEKGNKKSWFLTNEFIRKFKFDEV